MRHFRPAWCFLMTMNCQVDAPERNVNPHPFISLSARTWPRPEAFPSSVSPTHSETRLGIAMDPMAAVRQRVAAGEPVVCLLGFEPFRYRIERLGFALDMRSL